MSRNKDQTASALLARMAPVLDPRDWVYTHLPNGTAPVSYTHLTLPTKA